MTRKWEQFDVLLKSRQSPREDANHSQSQLVIMIAYKHFLALLFLAAFGLTTAWAADDPSYALSIRNHRFSPAQIEIPANTKVRLVIRNEDATPEEFDSTQLRREKVIPGGSEATLYVGPLPPGTYEFLGEFHPDTARGRLVVR